MKNAKYSIVFYDIKKQLNITLTEYCLLDIIKLLQMKTGYCYASKKYLSNALDISERAVFKLINKLEGQGFILKDTDNKQFLKVSNEFIEITTTNDYEQSSYTLQNNTNNTMNKVHNTMNKVHNDYEQSSYNNNNNINNNNNKKDIYTDYLNSIDNKNTDAYKLLLHIQNNYPEVSKMEFQMNYQNAVDLLEKYSKKEIDLILNNMDNWTPLLKKNKYVYKTIISWLNK